MSGLILGSFSLVAHAQGILTVTPASTTGTVAGTGSVGFSGTAATSATLAAPSAVAYDAAGNLYLADTRNHAIRKIDTSGNITTVAGIGVAGFGGDGAAATAALLDTPTGIAVDASGNLYIADSRNNRIRMVTAATGSISTIAGTGTAGFSGDGGAATAAALAQPSAVALDGSGDVLIADTNNQRIRAIIGTKMSTIAGSGVQGFSGDGGFASAASLDSPTGLAVDSKGNVYIADRHNQRVRVISFTTGYIDTIAGSGAVTFSGGFSGDGATATAATLSRPTGVSIDAADNLYIADTENQRIREISGSTIATVAGNGVQGFAGDGAVPTSANLNSPRATALDANGDISIADKLNQRIRQVTLATVAFGNQIVGTSSAGQTITLANTGTASFTVSTITYAGAFATSGGTCSATPITIAAGGSCTVLVSFTPAATGSQSGSITFSGSGVVTSKTLLSGTGVAVTPIMLVYTAPPATPITAGGNAGVVVVALEDAAGNVATSNSSTQVAINVLAPGATTGVNVYATATNGYATFNQFQGTPLTTSGTYTYTATASGLTQAVATEVVNPGAAASLAVSGLSTFTAPQMSGTATVKVTDSYGNTVTGFTGTVTLGSSDATATFSPASYTYTASDAGVHSFTVTFNTAGTFSVTAISGALTGSQTGVLVQDSIILLNTNSTIARLSDAGVQLATGGSANGTATFGALAPDNAGDIWAVNNATSTVQEYTKAGASVTVSGSAAAGVNTPSSLFIDGMGQVWVANGNNSISVLSAAGAAVTPSTGYKPGALSTPSGIVVDSSGSVWVTNSGSTTVTKVFGAAAPVVTPTVTGTVNNTLGTRP